MQTGTTAVLIYDARCSLCRGCMKWIELHAIRGDAFEFISCQSEERKKRFPEITDEACRKSLQLALSGGQILVGEEALPEILMRLKGYWRLCVFFRIPILKTVLYAVYRWVSNNRFIISQTIEPLVGEREKEQ